MNIVSLIVVLVVVGVILWLINSLIPMEPWVKKVINVLVILFVCLWLLQSFGLIGGPTLRLK